MTAPTGAAQYTGATFGRFNFLAPEVMPSLYRNGRVRTYRDADGSDGEMQGVVFAAHELRVLDARSTSPGLERNGVELLDRPVDHGDLDFFDNTAVVRHYYPACAAIVREATGGHRVFAFDHNIRSASGKQDQRRISGGQQVQGPAHIVHGDYTLRSAPERLQALGRPPGGNDTLRAVLGPGRVLIEPASIDAVLAPGGRFAIVNLWRSIAAEPVATNPLALCDAQSVRPEDLVVFEIHYADRIGENYFARHAERHRFLYYPAMTRDEALLIKQWDSAGPLARSGGAEADASDATAPCTFSFHTAFEDLATPPDAPDRWSIEVRCIVLYQD